MKYSDDEYVQAAKRMIAYSVSPEVDRRFLVEDADTIVDKRTGEMHRLDGFNAPEIGHGTDDKPAHEGGHEVSLKLAEWMRRNPDFTISSDGKDKYGRSISELVAPDGSSYNQMAVERGYGGVFFDPEGTYREAQWRGARQAQGYAGDPAVAAAGDAAYLAQFQNGAPQRAPRGNFFARAMERGADQSGAMLYAFANAVGESAGFDPLAEWGEEGAKQKLSEIMANPAEVKSWDDVDGLAAGATYFLEAIGEQVPQFAVDLAAAATGAGVGAIGARAALGKTLKRQLGEEAFEAMAKKAATRGAKIGTAAAIYGQSAGETQLELKQRGIDAPETALLTGVPKAALEYVGVSTLLGTLSRRTGVDPETLEQLATEVARKAGFATLTEAGTEGLQTIADFVAVGVEDPSFDMWAPENLKELRESMIKGGMVGGGLGAVGSLVSDGSAYASRDVEIGPREPGPSSEVQGTDDQEYVTPVSEAPEAPESIEDQLDEAFEDRQAEATQPARAPDAVSARDRFLAGMRRGQGEANGNGEGVTPNPDGVGVSSVDPVPSTVDPDPAASALAAYVAESVPGETEDAGSAGPTAGDGAVQPDAVRGPERAAVSEEVTSFPLDRAVYKPKERGPAKEIFTEVPTGLTAQTITDIRNAETSSKVAERKISDLQAARLKVMEAIKAARARELTDDDRQAIGRFVAGYWQEVKSGDIPATEAVTDSKELAQLAEDSVRMREIIRMPEFEALATYDSELSDLNSIIGKAAEARQQALAGIKDPWVKDLESRTRKVGAIVPAELRFKFEKELETRKASAEREHPGYVFAVKSRGHDDNVLVPVQRRFSTEEAAQAYIDKLPGRSDSDFTIVPQDKSFVIERHERAGEVASDAAGTEHLVNSGITSARMGADKVLRAIESAKVGKSSIDPKKERNKLIAAWGPNGKVIRLRLADITSMGITYNDPVLDNTTEIDRAYTGFTTAIGLLSERGYVFHPSAFRGNLIGYIDGDGKEYSLFKLAGKRPFNPVEFYRKRRAENVAKGRPAVPTHGAEVNYTPDGYPVTFTAIRETFQNTDGSYDVDGMERYVETELEVIDDETYDSVVAFVDSVRTAEAEGNQSEFSDNADDGPITYDASTGETRGYDSTLSLNRGRKPRQTGTVRPGFRRVSVERTLSNYVNELVFTATQALTQAKNAITPDGGPQSAVLEHILNTLRAVGEIKAPAQDADATLALVVSAIPPSLRKYMRAMAALQRDLTPDVSDTEIDGPTLEKGLGKVRDPGISAPIERTPPILSPVTFGSAKPGTTPRVLAIPDVEALLHAVPRPSVTKAYVRKRPPVTGPTPKTAHPGIATEANEGQSEVIAARKEGVQASVLDTADQAAAAVVFGDDKFPDGYTGPRDLGSHKKRIEVKRALRSFFMEHGRVEDDMIAEDPMEQSDEIDEYNGYTVDDNPFGILFRKDNRTVGTGKPLTVAEVQKVVDEVRAELGGMIGVDFHVVEHQDERLGKDSHKRHGEVFGYVDFGTGGRADRIVIVSGKHHSVSDVRATLRHEILGHYGFARVLGRARVRQLFNQLVASKDPVIRAAIEHAKKHYHDKPVGEQLEEALTYIAESTPVFQSRFSEAVSKVLKFIRDALRAVGLLDKDLSRNDVHALMIEVADRIRSARYQGQGPLAHGPMMRRSLGEAVRSAISPANAKAIAARAKQFFRAENPVLRWMFTADAELRGLGMGWVADRFFQNPGTEGSGIRGLFNAIPQVRGRWMAQVEKIQSSYSVEELQAAYKELQAGAKPSTAAARDIAALLENFHRYLRNRMPIGHLENYFPRVYNLEAIDKDPLKFDAVLQKFGVREPSAVRRSITEGYGSIDNRLDKVSEAVAPGLIHLHRRQLTQKGIDKAFQDAGFFFDNPVEALNGYMAGAIKKAEFESRFAAFVKIPWQQVRDTDTDKVRIAKERANATALKTALSRAKLDSLEQGIKFGQVKMLEGGIPAFYNPTHRLTQEFSKLKGHDQDRAYKIVDGYMGRLGATLDPRVRNAMSSLMVYESYLTLLFSGLASLPDLAGAIVASKDFAGMVDALKTFVFTVGNRKAAYARAKDLGYIYHRMTSQALMEAYGQAYTSGVAQKAVDALFKYNGQEMLTDFTRVFAAATGERFLIRHAHAAKAGNARSQRYLKELSISADDILTWENMGSPAWHMGMTDNESYFARRVQEAIGQFVDSAVVRPNAATRPLWGSDPRFMLIWHLKSFFYGYAKVVLQGIARESVARFREAGIAPAMVPFLIAGAFLLPLAAAGLEMREKLQYWDRDPTERLDAVDYTQELLSRVGVYGPLELAFGFFGFGKGDDGILALAGPTIQHANTLITAEWDTKLKRSLPVFNQTPALWKEVTGD